MSLQVLLLFVIIICVCETNFTSFQMTKIFEKCLYKCRCFFANNTQRQRSLVYNIVQKCTGFNLPGTRYQVPGTLLVIYVASYEVQQQLVGNLYRYVPGCLMGTLHLYFSTPHGICQGPEILPQFLKVKQLKLTLSGKNQDFSECPLFLGILARKICTRHFTRHETRQQA